jgi:hypothetical protein
MHRIVIVTNSTKYLALLDRRTLPTVSTMARDLSGETKESQENQDTQCRQSNQNTQEYAHGSLPL